MTSISFLILFLTGALTCAAPNEPTLEVKRDLYQALTEDWYHIDCVKVKSILSDHPELVNEPTLKRNLGETAVYDQEPLVIICQKVEHSSIQLAKDLLDKPKPNNADIDVGNIHHNPIVSAVRGAQLFPDFVKYLLTKEPKVEFIEQAFRVASREQSDDVFVALLDHLKTRIVDEQKMKNLLKEALFAAASKSNLPRMKRLVEQEDVPLSSIQSSDGCNAAHLVIRCGTSVFYEPLTWILSKDPGMMEVQNKAGKTPLDMLTDTYAPNDWFKKYIVGEYKRNKSDVGGSEKKDLEGGIEMKRSLLNLDVLTTNAVLKQLEVNPTAAFTPFDDGTSPLMKIAEIKSKIAIKIAEILIGNGANVNYRSSNGQTALSVAAAADNASLLEYMLTTFKIDIPEIIAVFSQCIKEDRRKVYKVMVEYMKTNVNQHLDRDWDGMTFFLLAASHGNAEFMQFLYETELVKQYVTINGDNAAHLAARSANPFQAILWIRKTLPSLLQAKNHEGQTPFMILKGRPELDEKLIKALEEPIGSGYSELKLAAKVALKRFIA